MAPMCECGHKASEHRKQMSMRTWCTKAQDPITGDQSPNVCECHMYQPQEDQ